MRYSNRPVRRSLNCSVIRPVKTLIILEGIEYGNSHIHAFESKEAFEAFVRENAELIDKTIHASSYDILSALYYEDTGRYGVYVYEIPLYA